MLVWDARVPSVRSRTAYWVSFSLSSESRAAIAAMTELFEVLFVPTMKVEELKWMVALSMRRKIPSWSFCSFMDASRGSQSASKEGRAERLPSILCVTVQMLYAFA